MAGSRRRSQRRNRAQRSSCARDHPSRHVSSRHDVALPRPPTPFVLLSSTNQTQINPTDHKQKFHFLFTLHFPRLLPLPRLLGSGIDARANSDRSIVRSNATLPGIVIPVEVTNDDNIDFNHRPKGSSCCCRKKMKNKRHFPIFFFFFFFLPFDAALPLLSSASSAHVRRRGTDAKRT